MSLDLTLTFEGHRVRMAGTRGWPEWIARDVCHVLWLRNTSQALTDAGVTAAERGISRTDTPGGPQDLTTVSESGLWKLIMASRKPSARRFKDWLATEVLPSIRRFGCYPPPAERPLPAKMDLDDPGALRVLVEALAVRRLADVEKIAQLEPKAKVYDACMSSADLLTVAQVANLMARPGRPMGEVRLFRWLREVGILQRDNRPYQEHVEAGRFVVRETPWTTGDGTQRIHVQPLATQRGAEYIRRRLDQVAGQRSLLPGPGRSALSEVR